jgi:hypothetical protein
MMRCIEEVIATLDAFEYHCDMGLLPRSKTGQGGDGSKKVRWHRGKPNLG